MISKLTYIKAVMTVASNLKFAVEQAIASGGETRYSIAKGSGVEYRSLVRWLDEDKDIRLSTVNAICSYLNLELRPKAATAAKPKPAAAKGKKGR